MSDRTTCADTNNVISLPASAAGPTPWPLPDGRLVDPCGLAAALASLSARQVKELGLTISGIYGRPGFISSVSADLQSCLESRFRARMQTPGLTLYTLTWKAWVTPSGVSRSRLRASVRRTSETGTTGWPTPAARDFRSESATDEFNLKRWAHARGKPLSAVALLAGWATPNCPRKNDSDNTAGRWYPSKKQRDLDYQALLTEAGDTSIGSLAQTASTGQLNPAHSRWLMGYPAAWDDCAPTEMPSSRKPRRSSSPATSKSSSS